MRSTVFLLLLPLVVVALVALASAKPDDKQADAITEVEALRYENAYLKALRAQIACEQACVAQIPDYAKATAALKETTEAILKAHKMDVAKGDKFDFETRAITRGPAKPAAPTKK